MAKQSSAQPATKSDLDKNIKALRAEVKRGDRALRGEMLRLEERVERVEEKVETMDEKFDKKFDYIMTTLDGIAKGVDDLRTENTVGTHQTRELRVQVDDHEKRLEHLESAAQ